MFEVGLDYNTKAFSNKISFEENYITWPHGIVLNREKNMHQPIVDFALS